MKYFLGLIGVIGLGFGFLVFIGARDNEMRGIFGLILMLIGVIGFASAGIIEAIQKQNN